MFKHLNDWFEKFPFVAGHIVRDAGVGRIELFHFSPRYAAEEKATRRGVAG